MKNEQVKRIGNEYMENQYNIKDLKRFIIVGEGVLKAHKSLLKSISKVDTAQKYYNAKLADGQRIGEIVIEAQGKLGKMLSELDKKESYTGFLERKPVLPEGITYKDPT